MSENIKVDIQFKDKKTLIDTLIELGVRGIQQGTRLEVINSYSKARVYADIVIRKEDMPTGQTPYYADIAFPYNPETKAYEMIVDETDAKYAIKNFCEKIKTIYADKRVFAITNNLKTKGYSFTKKEVNGQIQYTGVKY